MREVHEVHEVPTESGGGVASGMIVGIVLVLLVLALALFLYFGGAFRSGSGTTQPSGGPTNIQVNPPSNPPPNVQVNPPANPPSNIQVNPPQQQAPAPQAPSQPGPSNQAPAPQAPSKPGPGY